MKIIVVGCGLVGGLAARIFAQSGHDVEIFECRSNPLEDGDSSRSINMGLSERGRKALSKAGLEKLVLNNAVPMKGRMLHQRNGSTKEVLYSPMGDQCVWSVSRQYILQVVLNAAMKMPNVKHRFQQRLVHVDLENGILSFRNEVTGEKLRATGDLLIGADGAHSVFRNFIVQRGISNFSQSYSDIGYLEITLPAKGEAKQHPMAKNYLHLWPRDTFVLSALPNPDGTFTCTLCMTYKMFNSLNTDEAILKFFQYEFPDIQNLIDQDAILRIFRSTSLFPLITIKCNPINARRGILLGDAAHAMVPFYGQGMNAGFEDVVKLAELLSGAEILNTSIECRLSDFSEKRCADAEAICDLSIYNFSEISHLMNGKWFYWRRSLDFALHAWFGKGWVPLYYSVAFTQMSYSACQLHRKWQDKLLSRSISLLGLVVTLILAALIFFLYLENTRTFWTSRERNPCNISSFHS